MLIFVSINEDHKRLKKTNKMGSIKHCPLCAVLLCCKNAKHGFIWTWIAFVILIEKKIPILLFLAFSNICAKQGNVEQVNLVLVLFNCVLTECSYYCFITYFSQRLPSPCQQQPHITYLSFYTNYCTFLKYMKAKAK